MRDIDRRECLAMGKSPKEALRMSLRDSLHALTAIDPGGKPLAMLGVYAVGMLSGTGSPWLLGRDEVFNYGRDLLILGPRLFSWWHETFDVLENLVSVENVKAIRLLNKWGAQVGGPVHTYGGVDFTRFRFTAAIQGQRAAA
jgi:hypothetical protein